MHSIITTPGFIIDAKTYGETGKVLQIFTKDLGLVRVIAEGIRAEKSKLRYHSQLYDLSEFSLVKGKEYWRLTGAASMNIAADKELSAKISAILGRLLHGEEPNADLFDAIYSSLVFSKEGLSDEEMKSLESLSVIKILGALGYMRKDKETASLFEEKISKELLAQLEKQRPVLIQRINQALRETQL